MLDKNLEMIQLTARALGSLKNEVVFVGGASVSCYLNLETADEVRPTEDVDVIIEVASMSKYQILSEKLLQMKFTPDQSKGAPMCRWKFGDIIVDIMPLDEKILGFSNKFYKEGLDNRLTYILPMGEEVYILPLSLFLATKVEAFKTRGKSDPRFSKDLEDIVTVLLDARDFESVFQYEPVLPYLRSELKSMLSDDNIIEAVKGFIQSQVSQQFDIIKKRCLFQNRAH